MKKYPLLLGALVTVAVLAGIVSLCGEIANLRRKTSRRADTPSDDVNTADGSRDTPDDRPSNEDIAQLAQHYWEEEGYPEGKAQEHWRRAEEELRPHV